MSAAAPPATTGPLPPSPGHPRPRRRGVRWVSVGVAVVLAVLVAVLATSGPASQQQAASPLVGRPAPALAGPDQTGAAVSLASYRGRWVLVNFAASWCQPCQQETPQLLTFAADAARSQGGASGGPAIVTVSYDHADLGALRRFLDSRHAAWPVVDDEQASVRWGVGGLPESYLVDPEGTVVAKVTGGVVARDLEKLIGEFPAS